MTREYALVQGNKILEYRWYDGEISDQTKLHPSKPRLVPVVIEDPNFDPDVQVKSGPVDILEGNQVRRVYTVRNFDASEVSMLRVGRMAAVKAEAQRRIYEIMPAHKQTNWLAKKAELDITYGPVEDWPQEWKDVIQSVLPLWQQIEAIRHRSNQLEANLAALTTARAVCDFNPLNGWEDV